MVLAYLLVALTGASMASFASAYAFRRLRHRAWIHHRSSCDACCAPIPRIHVIPVVGFFLAGGKCGRCRERIDPCYPATEAVMAAAFLALLLRYEVAGGALAFAVLCVLLALGAEIDRRQGVVPNSLILVGTGLAIALSAAGLLSMTAESLKSALAVTGLLLLLRWSGRWFYGQPGMGMGDVKLVAMEALFLKWAILWVLYASFLIAGLWVVAGLYSGRMEMRASIPFAPFLALATAVGFLTGFWLPVGV